LKKSLADSACALLVLSCLLCRALPVVAQQPSAGKPPQPAATNGQPSPPRAPEPRPAPTPTAPSSKQSTERQEEPRADFPTPYYNYPFGSRTTTNQSLSVNEAVALALSNATSYRSAQIDEKLAAEDVRQARAAFLPQLSLPLTYFGTTPSRVRAEDEPRTFSYVSSSAINETIALFQASGEIDLSGRLRAVLRRSRALLSAAHAGALVARRALVLDTIDAYYGLALAREKRRLADETLALAEGFVKVSEGLVARGEGEEADVARARSAAATRRDELEQARAAEAAAMNVLRVLTGVDFSTYLGIIHLADDVPTNSDFPGYTEESIKARPELSQLEAQRNAALAEARGALGERLPQLTYTVNGGFDAGDFRPLGRYAGSSGIFTLSVPVFNFGASKSRQTQARLRAAQLDIQREAALRQLRQEFYTARANALSALERIKSATAATASAQRNVTFVFARYRTRKATILDVLDAQSNFAATRLAYYQAIADYRTARVRLEADPEQLNRAQSAPSVPVAIPARCALNRAQAPDVGGLRLGLSLEEVRALFPTLIVPPPDEFGVADAFLAGPELFEQTARKPFFAGAVSLALEFLDGKLTYIAVGYPLTNQWESNDAYVASVARKLNIPGQWKPFYDVENKDVRNLENLRDLTLECSGFRLSAGIGIEGNGRTQTPHFELEDLDALRLVETRKSGKQRPEKKD
jgi:outer membrane protein TolC